MKYTDIAIIGGGLAGSTAAAMLGRAGIPTVLIDPHQVYPFDFRVEKISGDEQLGRFYQTGIADSVLRSATHDGENWIARFGYLLDKKPSRQYGIMYDALIGAVRADAKRDQRRLKPLGSLLVVLILVVVVFIVVVGLTGRGMRLAALVVPELSIGAVGGQKLGM